MAAITRTTPDPGRAVADPARRPLVGAFLLGALSGAALTRVATLTWAGTTPEPSRLTGMAGSPDAGLIGLCARCDRLQARIDALHVPPDDDDAMSVAEEIAWEQARDALAAPLVARRAALFRQVCALRATTLPGHAARAATLAGLDPSVCEPPADDTWFSQLVGAVVRDLAARG